MNEGVDCGFKVFMANHSMTKLHLLFMNWSKVRFFSHAAFHATNSRVLNLLRRESGSFI